MRRYNAPVSRRLHALILDPAHRVLLEEDGGALCLPAADVPGGVGPLRALSQELARRFGLALPAPIGSRVPPGGGAVTALAFVLEERADAPEGARFVRLAEAVTAAAERDLLWQLYVELLLGGYEPPTRALEVLAFGDGGAMAARLAHLVVAGAKRATATWVREVELEGAELPRPDLVSVVVDGFGCPRCVIATEEVHRVRFGDVDAALAALEGEGDRTLEDWRAGHLAFFTDLAGTLGLPFSDEEEIAIERFRVLHVIGRADPA